jgi:hypothetical protein
MMVLQLSLTSHEMKNTPLLALTVVAEPLRHGLALFSLPNLQWHLLGREVANSAVMVVVPGLVDDRPVMVGI